MSRLLVVDDEPSICWGLSRLGETLGHEVMTASSAEQGLAAAERAQPDAIVLDVRLPGMDGLTAIEQFRQRAADVPIILITAYGDLETAVDAVRRGANEYIVKPFELDKIERAIERAIGGRRSSTARPMPLADSGLIGRSPAMQEVFRQIALAAAAHTSVLLCGESGTGKDLVARAIHRYSDRSRGPFVAVNVASLSASVTESELFGHVRGAFTGANHDRVGLIAQANGGTLFLDEVADIPLSVQVKLLRTLDHAEVIPVGSSTPVKSDFRIVSATNQDLLERVRDGSFRHDLYFRLAAFRIDLPPLRRRSEDIQELAEYFLATAGRRGACAPSLSEATLRELQQRPWYGNVRELRNTMEHAAIMACGGIIEPDHLPEPVTASLIGVKEVNHSLEQSIVSLVERWATAQLEDEGAAELLYEQLQRLVEPPLLKATMEWSAGQCAAAARRLGIHRTTLRKKLDDYGIDET